MKDKFVSESLALRGRFYIVLLVLLSATSAWAQSVLSVRGELSMWGIHNAYKFEKNGDILRRGATGFYRGSYALQFKLNYKVRQSYAFEAMVETNEQNIGVYDADYFSRYHLDRKQIRNKFSAANNLQEMQGFAGAFKRYRGAGLAFYKFFLLDPAGEMGRDVRFYVSGGMLYHWIKDPATYLCTYHDKTHGETLLLSTRFKPQYQSFFAEGGIHYSDDRVQFYIGLRYGWSFSPMAVGDYSVVNETNGQVISSDRVNVWPNYLAFTITGGPNIAKFRGPQKKTREKDIGLAREETVAEKDTAEPVAKDTVRYASPGLAGGRKASVSRQLDVYRDTIRIFLWDKGIVDGDEVTIFLNGEKVYSNLELTADKHELLLVLKPGENILVMYVEDEGTIKPCTAAVWVQGGGVNKIFELSSDIETSGSVRIVYHP